MQFVEGINFSHVFVSLDFSHANTEERMKIMKTEPHFCTDMSSHLPQRLADERSPPPNQAEAVLGRDSRHRFNRDLQDQRQHREGPTEMHYPLFSGSGALM